MPVQRSQTHAVGKHTMKAGTTPEEEARAWSNLFGVNAVDTNNDGKVDRAEWEVERCHGDRGPYAPGRHSLCVQPVCLCVFSTASIQLCQGAMLAGN